MQLYEAAERDGELLRRAFHVLSGLQHDVDKLLSRSGCDHAPIRLQQQACIDQDEVHNGHSLRDIAQRRRDLLRRAFHAISSFSQDVDWLACGFERTRQATAVAEPSSQAALCEGPSSAAPSASPSPAAEPPLTAPCTSTTEQFLDAFHGGDGDCWQGAARQSSSGDAGSGCALAPLGKPDQEEGEEEEDLDAGSAALELRAQRLAETREKLLEAASQLGDFLSFHAPRQPRPSAVAPAAAAPAATALPLRHASDSVRTPPPATPTPRQHTPAARDGEDAPLSPRTLQFLASVQDARVREAGEQAARQAASGGEGARAGLEADRLLQLRTRLQGVLADISGGMRGGGGAAPQATAPVLASLPLQTGGSAKQQPFAPPQPAAAGGGAAAAAPAWWLPQPSGGDCTAPGQPAQHQQQQAAAWRASADSSPPSSSSSPDLLAFVLGRLHREQAALPSSLSPTSSSSSPELPPPGSSSAYAAAPVPRGASPHQADPPSSSPPAASSSSSSPSMARFPLQAKQSAPAVEPLPPQSPQLLAPQPAPSKGIGCSAHAVVSQEEKGEEEDPYQRLLLKARQRLQANFGASKAVQQQQQEQQQQQQQQHQQPTAAASQCAADAEQRAEQLERQGRYIEAAQAALEADRWAVLTVACPASAGGAQRGGQAGVVHPSLLQDGPPTAWGLAPLLLSQQRAAAPAAQHAASPGNPSATTPQARSKPEAVPPPPPAAAPSAGDEQHGAARKWEARLKQAQGAVRTFQSSMQHLERVAAAAAGKAEEAEAQAMAAAQDQPQAAAAALAEAARWRAKASKAVEARQHALADVRKLQRKSDRAARELHAVRAGGGSSNKAASPSAPAAAPSCPAAAAAQGGAAPGQPSTSGSKCGAAADVPSMPAAPASPATGSASSRALSHQLDRLHKELASFESQLRAGASRRGRKGAAARTALAAEPAALRSGAALLDGQPLAFWVLPTGGSHGV